MFPIYSVLEEVTVQITMLLPPVSLEKIEKASTRLYSSKAAVVDGVTNEALKVRSRLILEIFQKEDNWCMIDGVFPKPLKRARLVLLRKDDKQVDRRPTVELPPVVYAGHNVEAV